MTFLMIWVVVNTWVLYHARLRSLSVLAAQSRVNMLAALQAPIIMMSQNRQAHKDRLRANLDYQVNLKNELLLSDIIRRLDELKKASRD